MHTETQLDSLSLQRLLLTVAGGIGGTWKPALATIEDVAIGSKETMQLRDGKTLTIEHRMTAMRTPTLGYMLVLLRELQATNGSNAPAEITPARMTIVGATKCTFADADAVMSAIDIVTEELDTKMRTLCDALEAGNV